jgi:hypothetical protein
VESLIYANLFLNVYPQEPTDPVIPLINYLTTQGYFVNNQIVGAIPYKIISDSTLLSQTAPIGMLSYVPNAPSGQQLIQVSGCNSLNDLASNAAFSSNDEIQHNFSELFIAELIQKQQGIFKNELTVKLLVNGVPQSYPTT